MIRHCIALLLIILIIVPAAASTHQKISDTIPEERWKGTFEAMGFEMVVIVHFIFDEDKLRATIDIPQQGAAGIPLINVQYGDDSVYFELPAPPGLAVFDGKRDGNSITGVFRQTGITGTFDLILEDAEVKTEEYEPLLYREENIVIQNEGIKLGCTLTLPFTGDLHPAVILLTGSIAEYEMLDKDFIEGFPDIITQWINERYTK